MGGGGGGEEGEGGVRGGGGGGGAGGEVEDVSLMSFDEEFQRLNRMRMSQRTELENQKLKQLEIHRLQSEQLRVRL